MKTLSPCPPNELNHHAYMVLYNDISPALFYHCLYKCLSKVVIDGIELKPVLSVELRQVILKVPPFLFSAFGPAIAQALYFYEFLQNPNEVHRFSLSVGKVFLEVFHCAVYLSREHEVGVGTDPGPARKFLAKYLYFITISVKRQSFD